MTLLPSEQLPLAVGGSGKFSVINLGLRCWLVIPRRLHTHLSWDSPAKHLRKVGSIKGLAAVEEELKEVQRTAQVLGSWKNWVCDSSLWKCRRRKQCQLNITKGYDKHPDDGERSRSFSIFIPCSCDVWAQEDDWTLILSEFNSHACYWRQLLRIDRRNYFLRGVSK